MVVVAPPFSQKEKPNPVRSWGVARPKLVSDSTPLLDW
jgi:hypothetical protein